MTDIEKKSYFQGTEEPAVGQVKYPKEDADSVRNNLDKQMTGQMNTGPVDGMHPGYESFGETEEARKRRLQRLAEEEKAALRREAALELAQEKLAYFQGTEEPTPGKPKYPKEDAESIRNKEDKQMTGQPPFPGVGDVDGLHPSPASVSEKDELKRKQMLSRAKYVAKLIKAMDSQGKDSLGNSRWDIYARSEGSKDRLVFSATVDELTHGNSELLGHGVITEQFGQKLLAKVRSEGLEKLAASLKVAQEMPAPAAPAMPAMPAMPAAPAMPEEPVKDEGGSGDPAENLDELLDDTETNLVELRKGIEALTGTSDNELKEFEGLADQGALSPVTSGLINNAKKLAFALAKSMKNTASELSVAKDELEMAKHVLSNKLSSTQRKQALDMTKQSMENAKNLLSKSYQCMDNFNQLAFGMEVLVKKASQEANMVKMAQDPTAGVVGKVYQKGDPFMPLDAVPGVPYQPKADAPKAVSAPKPSAKPASRPKPSKKDPNKLTPQELENLHRARPGRAELMDPMLEGYSNKALTTDHKAPQGQGASGQDTVKTVNFDKAKADDQVDEHELKMSADGTLEGSPEEMGKVLKQKDASEEFDLSTKAGRMAWRAKQAKDLQFSKILNDAHKGGTTLKFDMKPTGDMAKVDTLEEVQKAVKDVALKEVSVKTKKAAESIQKQVLAGAISADKVDELASFGVDKDAINYWKQFYGEAKDSAAKEFAKELTSDHEKAKKAESLEVERVRMKRAYELASEMQERGVIEGNKVAREEFVDAVLKLNDEGFESYAQMLNRMPSKTAANKFPQVKGASFFSDEEKSEEFGSTDLGAQFAAAFAGRKY